MRRIESSLKKHFQYRSLAATFFRGKDFRLMPRPVIINASAKATRPEHGAWVSITDPSVLDPVTLNRVVTEIVEPTLQGARDEGFMFRGVLFIGLMLTADGPRVLEYNVRFGS